MCECDIEQNTEDYDDDDERYETARIQLTLTYHDWSNAIADQIQQIIDNNQNIEEIPTDLIDKYNKMVEDGNVYDIGFAKIEHGMSDELICSIIGDNSNLIR